VTKDSGFQVPSSLWPTRERVGLIVDGANTAAAVKTIVAAETAGVQQIWMAQPTNLPDALTTFAAAAAAKISTVSLGTSILPTYPRLPLVIAQQALALQDLAPGRLRLGIGPSHRFIIENMYGLQHSKPLAHLREYVEVLRAGKLIIMDISIMLKPCFHVRRRYQYLSQH
jgi:alkanesulfonate monooxygenase SsuD/methylene tetrahydromethanopterin reductase-like flavin-dependent oxidoreductase (luciferase family)